MNIAKTFFAIIAVLTVNVASAQSFIYNATLLQADGTPAAGEGIEVSFAIKNSSGIIIYAETHSDITADNAGAINAEVGTGHPTQGAFKLIDWSDPSLEAEIEITRANGVATVSVEPIATAPAALGASFASSLLSTADNDGGKYRLVVDDNGVLSTVYEPSRVIEIPSGYSKMIFHDEFDVDGMPNPKYWGYEQGYVRGGEMQYYTVARPENTYIKDGKLHIVTLNDNWTDAQGTTHAVTSASVMTKDKVKFTYGRVDIRAKLPICLGSWPALWMMPNDDVYGYWPNSGEIDIIEHVGFNPNIIYFTAHCAEQNGANNSYHYSTAVPTCTTEFHVYSLVWTESKLEWLIDGKRKFSIVNRASTWRGWPFNRDFYLIMNTAFGGSWGAQKGVDVTALPITFEIDYVRVFQ